MARFGTAGSTVLVESFLEGEEASLFVVTDGTDYVLLPAAQDHKRIGEGDTGPNTGGMGAYAPAPVVTPAVLARAEAEVVRPVLEGMAKEGHPYRGNPVRRPDDRPGWCGVRRRVQLSGSVTRRPKCCLPLLESDPLELFEAVAHDRVADLEVGVSNKAAACVVLASEGLSGLVPQGTADPRS